MNKPKKTIFHRPMALLNWWWKHGHTRLKAAQLRRRGLYVNALSLLAGPPIILEMIKAFPNPVIRMEQYRSITRELTSPNVYKKTT